MIFCHAVIRDGFSCYREMVFCYPEAFFCHPEAEPKDLSDIALPDTAEILRHVPGTYPQNDSVRRAIFANILAAIDVILRCSRRILSVEVNS